MPVAWITTMVPFAPEVGEQDVIAGLRPAPTEVDPPRRPLRGEPLPPRSEPRIPVMIEPVPELPEEPPKRPPRSDPSPLLPLEPIVVLTFDGTTEVEGTGVMFMGTAPGGGVAPATVEPGAVLSAGVTISTDVRGEPWGPKPPTTRIEPLPRNVAVW